MEKVKTSMLEAGEKKMYGIIGWPVSHSLSPSMHQAAFDALGIAASYEKVAVQTDMLATTLKDLKRNGFAGFNVTIPHKESILSLLDTVSEEAMRIGAVNTVIQTVGGHWHGTNTDSKGFVRGLQAAGVAVRDQVVLIIGAGGSARAIAFGLMDEGATSITIASRRMAQAKELVASLKRESKTPLELRAITLHPGAAFPSSIETIVQTTPLTMNKDFGVLDAESTYLIKCVPWDRLHAEGTVVDIVYRPLDTFLLHEARRRGLRAVDGLAMLLHQGALAFELWTGQTAPVDVMEKALLSAL